MGLELARENTVQINTNPSGVASWANLACGFENIGNSMSEVLNQGYYLCDSGFGHTDVTGGQVTLTLSGKRKSGDTAQDYIFAPSIRYGFGAARETQARLTYSDGTIIEWACTLVNIQASSGDAGGAENVSVDLHFNGAPTIISGGLLGKITVVSLAGTNSGDTKLYVNPSLTALHSYKYKIVTALTALPSYNDVLTTGWTAWNGIADVTAATGTYIMVAEVLTADNKIKKLGSQVVTAKA